jgi:hypothetical protein
MRGRERDWGEREGAAGPMGPKGARGGAPGPARGGWVGRGGPRRGREKKEEREKEKEKEKKVFLLFEIRPF